VLPFGFRILGNCFNLRRLVNAGVAFEAYSQCDPRAQVTSESYLSAFQFGADFRELLERTGSPRNFAGESWGAFSWFDIDREHDPAAALDDVRRLGAFILERFVSLDEEDLLIFYSGSKGFHLGLPSWVTSPGEGSANYHRICRCFAEGIASKAGIAIDDSIYDRLRVFRAPNSRHPKSGLHKRRLAYGEWMGLSLDRVRELAREPHPFAVSAPKRSDPQAVADWRAAAAIVAQQQEGASSGLYNQTRLNRLTLQFIREGAQQGDRHRLLFSAAANLAEFGCPAPLAHALLAESSLDSGLSPREVRRQIDCGLRHGGKHV
jgi:hypothetical protein